MSLYLLSFVGNQDPYSGNTEQVGSIATLAEHLRNNGETIAKAILLYSCATENTPESFDRNAKDTEEWLLSEKLCQKVILRPVSSHLSDDPIDLGRAVEEAKKALDLVPEGYTVAFNSSSGTPTMKSTWSILQAAGYTPKGSHVWQVRNPKQMRQGQARVFRSDLTTLRWEFDRSAIERQIQDFNYSGALNSLQGSSLSSELIEKLCQYGHCRISFDFKKAHKVLPGDGIDQRFYHEIDTLSAGNDLYALCCECYYVAVTKLRNNQYTDFLILLKAYFENALRHLIEIKTNIDLSTRNREDLWQRIKSVEGGRLFSHIHQWKMRDQKSLDCSTFLNSLHYQAMAHFFYQDSSTLLDTIDRLIDNQYMKDRNQFAHNLKGMSDIPEQEAQRLLKDMRELFSYRPISTKNSPYNALNDLILKLLRDTA